MEEVCEGKREGKGRGKGRGRGRMGTKGKGYVVEEDKEEKKNKDK